MDARCVEYPTRETAVTTDDANLRFFGPPELPPTPGYAHVAEVTGGRTIHVSGRVVLDRPGEVVGEGDSEDQARQRFSRTSRRRSGLRERASAKW